MTTESATGVVLTHFEKEQITAAAYEVNRRYCLLVDPSDNSHVPWDNLEPDLKLVALTATAGIARGDGPEKTHETWVTVKQAMHWKYGPVKNQETKEHPCLMPFADLDPAQKAKDLLWHSTVKSMIETRWRIPRQ
jgi:RyR domain-containing protein